MARCCLASCTEWENPPASCKGRFLKLFINENSVEESLFESAGGCFSRPTTGSQKLWFFLVWSCVPSCTISWCDQRYFMHFLKSYKWGKVSEGDCNVDVTCDINCLTVLGKRQDILLDKTALITSCKHLLCQLIAQLGEKKLLCWTPVCQSGDSNRLSSTLFSFIKCIRNQNITTNRWSFLFCVQLAKLPKTTHCLRDREWQWSRFVSMKLIVAASGSTKVTPQTDF